MPFHQNRAWPGFFVFVAGQFPVNAAFLLLAIPRQAITMQTRFAIW